MVIRTVSSAQLACVVLIARARTHTAHGVRSFQPRSVQAASDDHQRPYYIMITRIMVTLVTHQQRLSLYVHGVAILFTDETYEYMALL